MERLGIFRDLSNSEYHKDPAISKSGLDEIDRAPLHYHAAYLDPAAPEDNERKAFTRGTALHCLVLEPQEFAKRYAVLPEDAPRRPTSIQRNAKKPSPETVAAIEFWDDFENVHAGKNLLSRDEWDLLHAMRDAVMKHPAAGALLTGEGENEVSYFWTDPVTGVRCKCRPDRKRKDSIVVDLKKTRDGHPKGFAYEIEKYRYHVGADFYCEGIGQVEGERPKAFVWIAVEDVYPYAVGVYYATEFHFVTGRELWRANLDTYADCLKAGIWPGYGDLIQPAGLTPRQQFMSKDNEDNEGE